MGITLNNTGASGTVNITLNVVTSYDHIDQINWYRRQVPGKDDPEIDTTSRVVMPRTYRITAYVIDSDKTTLQTLKSESSKQIKLTDNEVSNQNVRLESLNISANPGHDDDNLDAYPWIADIVLVAEDH